MLGIKKCSPCFTVGVLFDCFGGFAEEAAVFAWAGYPGKPFQIWELAKCKTNCLGFSHYLGVLFVSFSFR